MRLDLFNELEPTASARPRGSWRSLRRPGQRSESVRRIHAVFGLAGFVLGVVGAIVAYNAESSIALSIVIFFVIQSFIGRGLGDVATDRHKVKRFVYFALQPTLVLGVLYATYVAWETMWLSAVLGIIIGTILWQLQAFIVFPEIHEEETEDSLARFKSGGV